MSTKDAPPLTPLTSPWLARPVVDVLIGAGLLALPLLFVTELVTTRVEHGGSLTLVVAAALAVVLNAPHYAATAATAWTLSARTKRALVAASIVAVVVVVAAHAVPALLALLFSLALTWAPFHAAGQNHTLAVVMVQRAAPSAALSAGEARAHRAAHLLLALAAVVTLHSSASEPNLWRAGVDVDVARVVVVVCAAVAVLAALLIAWRLRARGHGRAGLWPVLFASTSFVWFALPALFAGPGAVVYATGSAPLLHGAQALWVSWFVAGRLAHLRNKSFDVIAYAGLVVAGGVALFTLGPWVVSRGFGYDLVISLLIVQAVVNVHHFVVDAIVWRAGGDDLPRALLGGNERAPANRAAVSNAKALAVTVPVCLLLGLAVVDVVQLAGTRPDAPEALALRAQVLNDNDSRVWVQSASQAATAGDVDNARADLGRAVALSPYNSDAQRALMHLHVVTGRDDEAWARHTTAPFSFVPDLDRDVLAATVALRLKKNDEALALADRALRALRGTGSLGEVDARRVRGEALLAQSKHRDAIDELKGAYDEAQAALGYDPLPKGQLLELGLALGDGDALVNQTDAALSLYARVLEGAQAANRPDMAFRALVSRGRVFNARGSAAAERSGQDFADALSSWQSALSFVDDAHADAGLVGEVWLDYAALLARSQAPMRLRYAAALKARASFEKMAAGPVREEKLKGILEALTPVEEALGADVESVRKDVDAAAKEALLLRYPDAADGIEDEPTPPPALVP
jgi:tetratricopeptide (TPR) repeat protein